MAAGRLSNDAYVDVVEANTQNSGNFIHWGMQYTPQQEYCWEAQGGSWDSVGSNGVDVQLHDINNDGYDDVFFLAYNFEISSHYGQNWEVVVALNNGFSNLGNYFFTSLPAGSYNHLYLGDFNEDGMQDLYITCMGCRDLVLTGRNGGKHFDLEFVNDGSDDSRGAIILDVNNDQHLDIFVIKHNKANVLLLGDGEGNFIASTLVNSTKYFGGLAGASADFNEDGAPDFVVTNASPNPALLFLSTCECPPSSSSSSEEEPASSSSSESLPEEASSSSGSEVVADGVIDDSEEESSNGDDSSLDIDDGVIPTDGSSDSSSSSSSSSNVAGRNGEDDGDDGNSSMTIGLGVGLPILLLLLLGAIIVVAFFVLRARKIAMTRASVIGASDEEIEEGRSIYASTDSLISTSGAKEKGSSSYSYSCCWCCSPADQTPTSWRTFLGHSVCRLGVSRRGWQRCIWSCVERQMERIHCGHQKVGIGPRRPEGTSRRNRNHANFTATCQRRSTHGRLCR
ncbi:Histone-lysine N-methyltransferase SETD1B-A-like isoform X2 [Balamuthia mandrillaris]